MRIAVTGSAGKLGTATVARLRADGHEVLGLDLNGAPGAGFTRVDLSDYGQVLDALLGVTARVDGFDAVVHLAAIPVNGLVPDHTTFQANVALTFNVLWASLRAGIRRIVMASSITAMGFPFREEPPYLPLDEEYLAANNTYGLSKVVEETMAGQLVRWDPELSVTALRFTNVVGEGDYATFERSADPAYRRDLLWTWVDARDGAQAVALALEHGVPGLEVYNIGAGDSGSAIPSAELAATRPGVPLRRPLGGFEPLISIEKARARLGYAPQHTWR